MELYFIKIKISWIRGWLRQQGYMYLDNKYKHGTLQY